MENVPQKHKSKNQNLYCGQLNANDENYIAIIRGNMYNILPKNIKPVFGKRNMRTCEILQKKRRRRRFRFDGIFPWLFNIFSQCGFQVFCHKTPDSWRNSSLVAACAMRLTICNWLMIEVFKAIYSSLFSHLSPSPPCFGRCVHAGLGRYFWHFDNLFQTRQLPLPTSADSCN